MPQTQPLSLRVERQRKPKFWFAILLGTIFLGSIPSFGQDPKSEVLDVSLQIPFWTNELRVAEDPLSNLTRQLSLELGHLDLRTLEEGLHSTILSLNFLTLRETRELAAFLNGLDAAELAKHNLQSSFKVIDAKQIEIVVLRERGRHTIAIRPHPEMIEWQKRLWKLLRENLPHLVERHQENPKSFGRKMNSKEVFIELVRFESDSGPFHYEEEAEAVRRQVSQMVQRAFSETNTQVVRGGIATNGLRLARPIRFSGHRPIPILSFGGDGTEDPKLNEWVRWGDFESGDLEEFRIRRFVNLGKRLRGPPASTHPEWIPGSVSSLDKTSKSFVGVSSDLVLLVRKHFGDVRPGFRPVLIETGIGGGRTGVPSYVGLHHPLLAPEKSEAVLPFFDEMGFLTLREPGKLYAGEAIYASGVRSNIENPSDYDLINNTLIRIPPDQADSYEEALAYASKEFNQKVFGHLRRLIRQGKVSLIELRIGSDYTMGLSPDKSSALRLLENPNLSEKDFLEESFVDRSGKTWKLEELLNLGDWVKTKIDLFVGGKHIPLSLQFFIGFEWGPEGRRRISASNTRGLKGVPPFMRTAVYTDQEGYLTSLILRGPDATKRTQRTEIMISTLSELLPSQFKRGVANGTFFHGKFIKRFFTILFLIASDPEIDAIGVINGTLQTSLSREEYENLMRRINEEGHRAINQPVLKNLASIRQTVVDFYELAERNQGFGSASLDSRLDLLDVELSSLRSVLEGTAAEPMGIHPSASKTKNELSQVIRFQAFIDDLKELDGLESQNKKIQEAGSIRLFEEFIWALFSVESLAVSDPDFSRFALDRDLQRKIETISENLPTAYLRYQKMRKSVSGPEADVIEELMGETGREVLERNRRRSTSRCRALYAG